MMRMCRFPSFPSFRRSQAGIAYVEFAMTLPLLLALLLGAIEMTRYILIVQKVEKASVTLSDLVAQSKEITTPQLNQLITAAGQIMQPYEFGERGYAIVTSVTRTDPNPARVNWQHVGGGSWTQTSQIGTTGSVATLPANFTVADRENVIFAEVYYQFEPILANYFLGTIQVYRVSIYKPRLGDLTSLGS
jgi:Flp pilus assembly protein TadG